MNGGSSLAACLVWSLEYGVWIFFEWTVGQTERSRRFRKSRPPTLTFSGAVAQLIRKRQELDYCTPYCHLFDETYRKLTTGIIIAAHTNERKYIMRSPGKQRKPSCSTRRTSKPRPTAATTTTGFTQAWRLWRHCCCRYGSYPLLVAIVVTAGCLMSLYSSASCHFLLLDIGFIPANTAWNQSTAQLGIFSYADHERVSQGDFFGSLIQGCGEYPGNYRDGFIEDDRAWNVARIVAWISGVGSIIAAVSMMIQCWMYLLEYVVSLSSWVVLTYVLSLNLSLIHI